MEGRAQCRLPLLLECKPEKERDLNRGDCTSPLVLRAGLKRDPVGAAFAGEKDQGRVWCTMMSLLCWLVTLVVSCTLSRMGVIIGVVRFAINWLRLVRCNICSPDSPRPGNNLPLLIASCRQLENVIC